MSELEVLYNRKRILEERIEDKKQEIELYEDSDIPKEFKNAKIKELFEEIDKRERVLNEVNEAIFNIEKAMSDEQAQKKAVIDEARKNIKSKLGIDPFEMVITGGTLSSNASESHLEGHLKTKEELETEMEWGKNKIKEMCLEGKISRPDASKLNSDLISVYSSAIEELSSGRHM